MILSYNNNNNYSNSISCGCYLDLDLYPAQSRKAHSGLQ